MSIILKQEPANSVPTPPFGKGTLFLDENNTFVVKNDDGNLVYFPTVNGANTQVFFNDDGSLAGDANFTYDSATGTLTVTNGNVVATGVKTDNLYYANGQPWDLQQPAGSNNQIQFNNDGSFGASANLTYNDTTQLLTVSGNIDAVNVDAGNLLTANYVSGTLTTNAQPNITSVGTLTSLAVTGNANVGNLGTEQVVATGNVEANYFIGNGSQLTGIDATAIQNGSANVRTFANANVTISAAGNANIVVVTGTGANVNGTLTVTGDVSGNVFSGNGSGLSAIAGGNVTGQVGNALVAGTVYTAAQPNITSVGTLSSLSVTGNVSGGNLTTGGAVVATGNVSGGNLTTNGALSVTGNANVGNIGAARGVFTGNVSAANVSGGNVVSANYLTGTLTTAAQPNITSVGSLTNLNVSGNAVITGNLTVDGNVNYVNVDTLAVEDPVISLGNGPNNTPLTTNDGKDRGTLLNYYTSAPVNAFMGWDNSNAEFAFGSNVSIANDVVTFNTLGNLRAGNFIGNGAALTAITGGNVTGQVANALVAGTVYTAAQPNITSVGTLTSLSVTGKVTAGQLQGDGGNISNIQGGNVSGAVATATTAGTVTTAAQPNITSVGTLTSLGVNGTVTATAFTANTGVFTGNGSGLSAIAGANVTGAVAYATTANSVAGANVSGTVANATYAVSAGSATTAGTVTTNAQPNITSVGTLSSLSVTGNANVGNIGATNGVFTNVSGNGAGLTSITGANVTGAVPFASTANAVAGANVSGQVSNALVAGTVYTAAQPNITSVGTLTSLGVSGNITAFNITANTGTFTGIGSGLSDINASNISTGTLAQARLANSSLTIGTTNISLGSTVTSLAGLLNVTATTFNGSLSGNATTAGTVTSAAQPNITSVGTLSSLAVTGNISGANLTGNHYGNGSALSAITGANVTGTVANATYATSAGTAGTVTTAAQPNITSVGTLTSLAVTGNISGNNLSTTNKITAGNGLQVTTGSLTVTNGNLDVTGNINVTGNLNYSNVTDLVVGDPLIYLGANNTGDTVDLGFVASYNDGTYEHTGLARNASNDIWTFFDGVVAEPTTVIDWANATYPTVKMGNLITTANANIGGIANITGNAIVGGALSVTGNANVGNIGATNGVFTNVSGNGANLSSITGANVTGTVANATYATSAGNATTAGTVTTAAQPNITSVGTLTSLTVTGNVTAGNLSAGAGGTISGNLLSVATGNITTINSGLLQNGNSNISITANGNVSISAAGTPAELVVTSTGVNVAGTLNATGNANVGNIGATNGVFTNVSGNGAALTALNASNISSGTLAQARLANSSLTVNGTSISLGGSATITANTTQTLSNGSYITGDTFNGGTARTWAVDATTTNTANKVVARDANGSFSANIITATLSGSATSATTAGTVTTNAQPNITSVGTLTSLGVNGTVTAVAFTANTGVFTGNGSGLSAIAGGNVTGTVANATYAVTAGTANSVAGANVSGQVGNALVAGTVYTAAQPNITSVSTSFGNLTFAANSVITLSGANANITGANLVSANFITGNGSGLSAIAGANVTGTVANATYATSAGSATTATSATTAGTVTTNAQPNITSVGTLTSLSVTGNASAGNLSTGGELSVSGNAIITGNLTINGNLTYVNVDTLEIEDPIIDLGTGPNGAAPVANSGKDVGTSLNYYDTAARLAFMGWDVSNAEFGLASVATITNEVVTFTTYGNLRVGNIIGNGQALTGINASNISSGTLAQARLANSSLTVNGTAISLGGSGTITANTTQALTLGSYLTGTSFNGGTAVTANVDATTTNTASKVVARDANGSFSANIITATLSGSATSATTAGTVTTAAQPNITSVGTLTSLSVTGAVTADTFQSSNNGGGTNFKVGDDAWIGDVNTADTISIRGQQNAANGYIVFGNADSTTKLGRSGSGALTYNATFNPTTLQTTAITAGANTTAGTVTGNWTLTAGSRFQATYADLAERYQADSDYEPGTVVVLGGEHEVTIEGIADSHKVAGVVTTNPAYIMNLALEGENVVEVALIGRVPCKVVGPVSKGDLLTTSSIAGYAHVNNNAAPGRIIGKALENFDGETGTIEIMVGRT